MANLETNINQAINDFHDIRDALNEKGQNVIGLSTSQYGNLIRNLTINEDAQELVNVIQEANTLLENRLNGNLTS